MKKEIIPIERIARSIRYLRGEKVLLDSELATLYGVATKVLNQAVKRNRERFPEDFMFQLTADEAGSLIFQFGRSKRPNGTKSNRSRSQIVTLKRGQNIKYRRRRKNRAGKSDFTCARRPVATEYGRF